MPPAHSLANKDASWWSSLANAFSVLEMSLRVELRSLVRCLQAQSLASKDASWWSSLANAFSVLAMLCALN